MDFTSDAMPGESQWFVTSYTISEVVAGLAAYFVAIPTPDYDGYLLEARLYAAGADPRRAIPTVDMPRAEAHTRT